jgi:hypothetical protein
MKALDLEKFENNENFKKILILIGLFLALIVQVFNTASLYGTFSHLTQPLKFIGECFVGVSLEFGIFICIYNGSRSAGAWFALGSFFVGIMFHDNWQGTNIEYDLNPFQITRFHLPKVFISSSLLQAMNSMLVWFFSELYVNKLLVKDLGQEIERLIKQKTEGEQDLAETNRKTAEAEQKLTAVNKEFTASEKKISKATELIAALEHDATELKQAIVSLQKAKAGASRGQAVNAENNG